MKMQFKYYRLSTINILNFLLLITFLFSGINHVVDAWVVERQIQVNCTSTKLWEIFQDVEGWNRWDPDLDYAELTEIPNKPSLEGAKGIVHMKNNVGSFDFQLHDLNPNGYVAYTTPLKGAVLDWYWSYSEQSKENHELLVLKEGLSASGPLSYVYKLFFAKKAGIAFEQALVNLKNLCEVNNHHQPQFQTQKSDGSRLS